MKRIMLAVVLMASAALLAQPPSHHIDFTQPLIGFDNKPLILPNATRPMTLGEAVVNALLTSTPDDQKLSGVEKYKLDALARKVYAAKDVELSVEELATIKDRVGKVSTPILVGAVWRILDPTEK